MNEIACLSVDHLALLFCMATLIGTTASTVLLKEYFVRRRVRKMSPSQSEMIRIAEYLMEHHPGVVEPGVNLSDITIRLIERLHKKSEIIT